jgi:hypothetical protein
MLLTFIVPVHVIPGVREPMGQVAAGKIDINWTGLQLGKRPNANKQKQNTQPALHQTMYCYG